jgi:hypothetical protein
MDEKYFCLTLDAESDDCWLTPERIKLDNFREIPRFQRVCEKYQIIPTYLLTYEYATYKPAIEFFRQKLYENKCEVGLHLHAWSTPPYEKEKNRVDLPWLYAYQYELPDGLFKKKLIYYLIQSIRILEFILLHTEPEDGGSIKELLSG